jgi:hypothetical protein
MDKRSRRVEEILTPNHLVKMELNIDSSSIANVIFIS